MWHAEAMGSEAIDRASVDVLLFDLGGVVIDIDFGRCIQHWATQADREYDDIASRFTFDAAYEDHERGDLDAAGYFAALRLVLSVELDDATLLTGWNDIYMGTVDGIEPLLASAAQHFPLDAFSNTNRSHQDEWSTQFADELALFRTIYVSSELGERKPDLSSYDAVVRRIGVPAGRILFFDDNSDNVVGAVDAGLQAVLVRSIEDVRTALIDLGVDLGVDPT